MAEAQHTGELYHPPKDVLERAHIKDWDELNKRAHDDYEGFWASIAEELHWFKKWDTVLDSHNKPFYQWFVGGKTNIVYSSLDRHTLGAHRNKLALIWEGEDGAFQSYSYFALLRKAGGEVVRDGAIAADTQEELEQQMVPTEMYNAQINQLWDGLMSKAEAKEAAPQD